MIEDILKAMVGLDPASRPLLDFNGDVLDPARRFEVRRDGVLVFACADEAAACAGWERIMLDDTPAALDILDRATGMRLRAHPFFGSVPSPLL